MPRSWWRHQKEIFSAYWPYVRSPVNSSHKGQWRGALMLSLICAWTNGWVNNRDAGDLRRHRAHYYVTVKYIHCRKWRSCFIGPRQHEGSVVVSHSLSYPPVHWNCRQCSRSGGHDVQKEPTVRHLLVYHHPEPIGYPVPVQHNSLGHYLSLYLRNTWYQRICVLYSRLFHLLFLLWILCMGASFDVHWEIYFCCVSSQG